MLLQLLLYKDPKAGSSFGTLSFCQFRVVYRVFSEHWATKRRFLTEIIE